MQNDFYNKIFTEADPNIKLKIYDVTEDKYPLEIDECDGYLITGSKLSVYDDVKWIRDLESFIRLLNDKKKSFGFTNNPKYFGKKTDDVVEKDDKSSSFKGRKKFKKRQRPKKFSFKKYKKK